MNTSFFSKPLISIKQHNTLPGILDIELNEAKGLQANFDAMECHVVLYPFSRNIKANNFHFYPYEEYARDIHENKKSAYNKISDAGPRIFGLIFSALVVMIVLKFNPQDFYSTEAIVSAFGAYVLGKDLWIDIERWLINFSKKFNLRMINPYFEFELDKNTTLTNYTYLAKSIRYSTTHILPQKMDYIEHSNSQTVRLFFNLHELEINESSQKNHILSVHMDAALLSEFREKGYMIGVKLTFINDFLGFQKCTEVFQSYNRNILGCLSDRKEWLENCIFKRETFVAGRLKYYKTTDIVENKKILELLEKDE